ncbi:unnamed protein product [Adineta steineri]|uniref:Uncharacterized protein n=1 Tax=Adineta steineri TaxID=433720 RepID=A0A820AK95_9BILA|nr:unnamed protein product [Adineta steineri]
MPRLQCLIAFDDPPEYAWHPLPPIQRLDSRRCDFTLFHNLPEHAPHLSTLFVYYTISSVRELSDILSSLYMRIPSLKLVSIKVFRTVCSNGSYYEEIAKQALVQVQNRNKRLRHLTLKCDYGVAEFFLRIM